ncbi:hypothetical protein CARN8_6010012 [mine drainage metagenome]|uniref:Uncharacterized protein n=1 Tax=mine drainage metagenome TaxID=410659 RepID=A0A3P3ZQT5_9ZZZZ
MKLQLTGRAPRLDLFHEALESDALALKLGDDLHQVGQAAAEAIKPPHHKGVPGAQRLSALLKLRPVGGLPAAGLFVDDYAPGLLERVALQVQVLVFRRDSGVADALIHGQNRNIEI